MSFPVKAWLTFYLRLILVSAWNGILRFVYVASGAAAAQLTQVVDLRTVGMKAFGWVLAGTVVASVADALNRHRVPEPNEPTAPNAAPPAA